MDKAMYQNSIDKTESEDLLSWTGERFMPHLRGKIRYEHLHRYALTATLVADKKVLDIACGEGYGSAILAKKASSVSGVDISSSAIQHATKTYSSYDNIEFKTGSVEAIPFSDHTFDIVVSFETLEHLTMHDVMLKEIKRVLKPQGFLILSTPDKEIYGKVDGGHNEFHLKELFVDEFKQLVSSHFQFTQFYGQRLATIDWIQPEVVNNKEIVSHQILADGEISLVTPILPESIFWISFCSDTELPQLPPSIFIDPDDDIFTNEREVLRWASSIDKERDTLQKHLQTLDALIDERTKWAKSLESELENERIINASIVEKLHSIERKFKDLTKEFEDKSSFADSLNNDLDVERRATHIIKVENQSLKDDVDRLRIQLTEISSRSRALDRDNQEKDIRIQKLERELEEKSNLLLTVDSDTVVKKADYLFFRLTQVFLGLYHLSRSPLGKLMYLLNGFYTLVTLRPHRTTTYISLVQEANSFVAEYKIDTRKPKRQISGRLGMSLQVLKYVIANPYTTLQQANIFRIKRVLHRLLFGDAAQTASWVGERFPPAESARIDVKLFDVDELADQLRLAIPRAEAPLVSIIIPVYNQYRMTVSCLQSIVAHTQGIEYEIIIADDCSSDLTTSITERITGLSVVKTPGNQGFLKNCNLAAKTAKGKYIMLLNNDTNVQPHWLDHLLQTAVLDKVGLVGPKLLFADGVLQEAGGIIWQDASGWNFGRGQDPMAPEFNYTRETDYISGACVLLERSLWERLGGFDERFCPAYYEDTDLAFTIRALGLKVIYEPKSVVVHFEGVSNGTDLNSGMKKHQINNCQVFRDKWKDTLNSMHFPNGQDLFYARDKSRNKKTIVYIDHYVPFFDKDAGSRSTFMYVTAMVKLGYNVKFLGANFFPHQPYTQILQNLGVEVLHGDRFARNWTRWFNDNAQYIDTIYLHRPHITEDFIDQLLQLKKRPKLVYFGHDLHFLRALREFEITKDPSLKKESEDWYRREMTIYDQVDLVLYPSDQEVLKLQQERPGINIKQLPLYQLNSPKPYTQAGRNGILFVGGFNHKPNVDGLLWFVRNVFPLVTVNTSFHIVGSSAPQEILNLASERILVHGYISDDELSRLYLECRISVVPLRYGAGVKGKVLEAMQAGIPLVTTSIGAEGIPEAESIFAIADEGKEFAKAIDQLYRDESISCAQVLKYHDVIEKYFSEATINSFIEQNFFDARE
jgi:GT2 family glycosyltransferase/ubiquinone/menaquinone biosynthesis C-methylase UbiE